MYAKGKEYLSGFLLNKEKKKVAEEEKTKLSFDSPGKVFDIWNELSTERKIAYGTLAGVAGLGMVAAVGYFSALHSDSEEVIRKGREMRISDIPSKTITTAATGQEKGKGKEALGSANDRAIEALINKANQCVLEGNLGEAELHYLTCLRLVQQMGGEDSPISALINKELAILYQHSNRLDQARKCLEAAAAVFRKSTQDRNIVAILVKTLCELAEVVTLAARRKTLGPVETNERMAYAQSLVKEAKAVVDCEYGQIPKKAEHKILLAEALKAETQVIMFTRKWKEAEIVCTKAIELLKKATYPTDELLDTSRMWLSQIMVGQGKYSDALKVCDELVKIHEETDEQGYFLRYSGNVAFDCDETSVAETLFLKALFAYRKMKLHEEFLGTVNDLLVIYDDLAQNHLVDCLINELYSKLNRHIPDTTSRYLRTLDCSVKPSTSPSTKHPNNNNTYNDNNDSKSFSYHVSILLRDRRLKELVPGTILKFFFDNPNFKNQMNDINSLKTELIVDEGNKTLSIESPPFSFSCEKLRQKILQIRIELWSTKNQCLAIHRQFCKYLQINKT